MKEDEILEFNYKNPLPKVDPLLTQRAGTPNGSMSGFPGDDALALQQIAGGNWDLGYYGSTFHQNETLQPTAGGVSHGKKHLHLQTEHTPIIKGTLVGVVYYLNEPVQTFVFNSAGVCTITKIGAPNYFVEKMEIKHQTGRIVADCKFNIADIKLVVSYETER